MEKAQRIELAQKLVDALENDRQEDVDRCLQSLQDLRANQLLRNVAELTREVHQAFGGVITDQKLFEITKHAMPDARERLAYIIEKSEEAAHRTLTAVEDMMPLAERLVSGADSVGDDPAMFAAYLTDGRSAGERLRGGLTEVLMAQEYQDLTGQVIKRTIDIVEQVEQKLVSLLVAQRPHAAVNDAAPPAAHKGPNIEAQGPAVRAASDVMNHQHDVDDLLAELGV